MQIDRLPKEKKIDFLFLFFIFLFIFLLMFILLGKPFLLCNRYLPPKVFLCATNFFLFFLNNPPTKCNQYLLPNHGLVGLGDGEEKKNPVLGFSWFFSYEVYCNFKS